MQMFFQPVLCLTVRIFSLPCTDFSVTKFSYDLMTITTGFPISFVAHSLLVLMWQLSHINTATLSLVSILAAVGSWPLWGLSPMSFCCS